MIKRNMSQDGRDRSEDTPDDAPRARVESATSEEAPPHIRIAAPLRSAAEVYCLLRIGCRSPCAAWPDVTVRDSHSDKPPRILSPSIVQFLAGALSLAIKDVNTSWDILRTYLWNCQIVPLTPEDFDAFKHFGWELGLSKSLHNYSVLYSNAYIQLQPLFIHPLDTVPTRVVTMVI